MALNDLVTQVDREMEKLRQIRALLTDDASPKARAVRARTRTSEVVVARPRRILSAEARKKIAAAQRARWAKLKKA